MLILGLTGGIATGKSTVSAYLKDHHGLPVVDADVIARKVVEPGTRGYKAIVKHFGPLQDPEDPLVLPSGTLNRPALGRLVFGNESNRLALNKIVHPAVRLEMARQVVWAWLTGAPIVVLDVPLLFESRLNRFTGTDIAVLCDEEVQLERLQRRDAHLSLDEAKKRIASQMSLSEKRERAALVIDNNGSLDDLYRCVDEVLAQVQPWYVMYLLEWLVPPVGLAMATFTAAVKLVRAKL